MKKMSFVMMLLLALTGIKAFAQNGVAQFRHYFTDSNGFVNYSVIHKSQVDSIVFVTEDFDVYAYTAEKPIFNDKAEWVVEVGASRGFSVETLKVCLVPATYTEEEILSAYNAGTLTNLRTLGEKEYSTEFTCGEGSFKPVAFGLDKEGNMRSHYVGKSINPIAAFQDEVTAPFKYGPKESLWSSRHFAWGYGSVMLIRNLMDDNHTMAESTYNHYSSWMYNQYLSGNYAGSAYVWQYYDNAIQKYSELIEKLKVEGIAANKEAKQFLGSAIAFRALHYLDAARMYEFLPNDGTSSINEAGNDVLNLTYPIGYSKEFTDDKTKVLRRATKDEMAAYILSELNEAESWLEDGASTDKEMVSKEVIDGLRARLYMWTEDYANAMQYAAKVIESNKHTVLTESEWLDPQKGFNNSSVSSWMLAMKYKENDPTVGTSIVNWGSWCTNQTTYGYNYAGVTYLITTSAYNRMSDTDFRKKSYKAPLYTTLSGQETYPDGLYADEIMPLASLKFRPGQGNATYYRVGSVLDVPLMRIEEMYFIQFEAMAQQGRLTAAKEELSTWIKQHRDPNYTLNASNQAELIDEIINQKSMELWGEGLSYFDYKRLNKSVTRSYEGTNVPQSSMFNTTTRPAWMNFVFYNNAYNGQINAWNNPDPSNCYSIQ